MVAVVAGDGADGCLLPVVPLRLVVAAVAAVVGTGARFVAEPGFGGAEESCASAADSCLGAPTASPVSQVAN